MERASGGLQNRDVVFFRNLADFQCDKVLALGDDDRGVTLFAHVTQRYRKVCRVGDDERRTRHVVDHAAASTVAGDRALAGFDHRVTLRLLVFFLHLMLRHFQLAEPVMSCPQDVHGGEQRGREQDDDHHF